MSNSDSRPALTAQRLRELLNYDPVTGHFTRKVDSHKGRWRAGDVAGCVKSDSGYIVIRIEGILHRAHRLAWLYVHGEWPTMVIDHKNRVRADNRIDNLRDATYGLNTLNVVDARKNNTLGILGVHQIGARFTAQINVGHRKRKNLGMFDTAEEAGAAYRAAKAARDATAVIA